MSEHNPRYAYEDLIEGAEIELGPYHVTAEEIIEFAREFDPQPFHLDEAAGKASILGGLAASGWHTTGMFMRMLCDAFLLDSTSQGAPSVEFGRWRRPVLAGDTLSGKSTVINRRVSRSKQNLGFVTTHHAIFNQHGDMVAEFQNVGMFSLREAGAQ